MQLVGNLKNLKNIVLPGSVVPIIHIVESSSNFQLFSNTYVKEYMDKIIREYKDKALVIIRLEMVNMLLILSIPFLVVGAVLYKRRLKLK